MAPANPVMLVRTTNMMNAEDGSKPINQKAAPRIMVIRLMTTTLLTVFINLMLTIAPPINIPAPHITSTIPISKASPPKCPIVNNGYKAPVGTRKNVMIITQISRYDKPLS